MSTKGTPRKRPYDVKRKLMRAAVKHTLCDGTFGSFGGATCVVGAYMRENNIEPAFANVGEAAAMLGLTSEELWEVIGGFDGALDDEDDEPVTRWYGVGQELRAALL